MHLQYPVASGKLQPRHTDSRTNSLITNHVCGRDASTTASAYDTHGNPQLYRSDNSLDYNIAYGHTDSRANSLITNHVHGRDASTTASGYDTHGNPQLSGSDNSLNYNIAYGHTVLRAP